MPNDSEDKETSQFKVRDHRRFDAEGKPREETEATPEPSPEPPSQTTTEKGSKEPIPEPPKTGPENKTSSKETQTPPPMPADFSSLVISLAASAQSGLGIAPNPATGQVQKDLGQAKHAIDLLEVLQEKTKGNLSEEEGKLIQALLYDLRMRYVEAT